MPKCFYLAAETDDKKTGGDIDLLVFSTKLDKKQLRSVKWHFYDVFGEQKMDWVLDSGQLDTPFTKMIFPNAIEL